MYRESKQLRMNLLSGSKKVFSRESEKSQAVKNRFGSQFFLGDKNKTTSKQTSKQRVLRHGAFHLKFVVVVVNMPRK